MLNANESSQKIKKAVNADTYITPEINGKHFLGGTYTRSNQSVQVDENDNRELIESLNRIYPDAFNEDDYSDAWVGFRVMSKDRVPIAGAVPDIDFFEEQYIDMSHGNTAKAYPAAQYLDGLYVFAAPGSRAFTHCFLCAEVIASQIAGEPLPVSKRVMDYLSPSRFVVNDLKRR